MSLQEVREKNKIHIRCVHENKKNKIKKAKKRCEINEKKSINN